jgi:transposase-like protein
MIQEPREISKTTIQCKSEEEIINKALQNTTPREQSIQERTDEMVRLIFQGKKNFTEIAQELGVARSTLYDDWNRWKQTEEAKQVDWEWWSLYKRLKRVNPSKALECLTRIKYRLTTEKIEVKEEIKEIKLVWNVNSDPNNPIQPTRNAEGIP